MAAAYSFRPHRRRTMSFADVAHTLPLAADAHCAPVVAELQRLLKPLAANNVALSDATLQLASPSVPPHPAHLRRVRALRDQNRQILRAASALVATVDTRLSNASAPLVQRANSVKSQFQSLLDQFSQLVQQSAVAENDYLQRTAQLADDGHDRNERDVVLSESQTALLQEAQQTPFNTATESQPLLLPSAQRTAAERATLRELHGTHTLAREQSAVLTEVQTSIHDVNSIFKDLAVMIADQRPQVEYVQVALSDSAHDVQRARDELEKTKRRHERNKRFFFLSLLSVALVVAVLLILVFN